VKLSSKVQAGIGLGLVLLAGPAGFLLYRAMPGSPHTGAQIMVASAPARADAPRSPVAAAASASPTAIPERLPDVALPDASGAMHELSAYRGKPLLLNFWASWCEPCRREIPLLETVHHRHGEVQVVGVAVDFDADALKFARAQGIDYPLLMGEKGGLEAARAVGVPELVLPFTVIADSRGKIVTVKLGELHADEADLILSNLAQLEAGRQSLADTRRAISDGQRDLAVIRAKDTQMGAN